MSAVTRIFGVLALLSAIAAAHAQTVQPYAVVCATICVAAPPGQVVLTEQPAGYVLNVILWDGVTRYTPPDGTQLQLAGSLQIGQVTQVQ